MKDGVFSLWNGQRPAVLAARAALERDLAADDVAQAEARAQLIEEARGEGHGEDDVTTLHRAPGDSGDSLARRAEKSTRRSDQSQAREQPGLHCANGEARVQPAGSVATWAESLRLSPLRTQLLADNRHAVTARSHRPVRRPSHRMDYRMRLIRISDPTVLLRQARAIALHM